MIPRTLDVPLKPKTYAYGKAFEHFIITEIFRLNSYFRKNFRMSYLLTKDGAEINLILERPGKPLALIEIESTDNVTDRHIKHIQRFAKDIPNSKAFCLSKETHPRKVGSVRILPWQQGIKEIGL